LRPLPRAAIVAAVLAVGKQAPDFSVGATTLYEILETRVAVVFFFPKAFTPG